MAAALSTVGVDVKSIYDLVNSSKAYPAAIPVLLNLLDEDFSNGVVKEGIVRALSVKEAIGIAARPLIEQFKKAPNEKELLRWTIGNALSIVADDSVVYDIIDLVKDKRNGNARQMLTVALANTKDRRVVDVLIESLDDDGVAGHALIALRKLKAVKARDKIERLTDHPKHWIAKEARLLQAKVSPNAGLLFVWPAAFQGWRSSHYRHDASWPVLPKALSRVSAALQSISLSSIDNSTRPPTRPPL